MRSLLVKVFISIATFTAILIIIMSLVTNQAMHRNIIEQQQEAERNIEEHIISQLREMDSAHAYFAQIEDEQMEKGLYELREYYEQNPDFSTWDLAAIKEDIGAREFYVIDANNRIVITTHAPSVGMDFNECCTEFVRLIQERLQTDEFYFDGLENSAATRDAWMYSYLPTKDHQYLLEYGIRFGDTSVSKHFSYESTVENLTKIYTQLIDLRIMTIEGFVLNTTPDFMTIDDTDEKLQHAYNEAVDKQKTMTVVQQLADGYVETHRFIPYEAEEARGNATQRIIYAKYDNSTALALLQRNEATLKWMLVLGIVTSLIVLFIILKLFSKTIRLATYDVLTGAYNRASYLQYMDEIISSRNKYPIGLMLIDLDNFKQLNDQYGHAAGDEALQELVMLLKEAVGKSGYVVRFGGDEFAIVFEKATPDLLHQYANAILKKVRAKHEDNIKWTNLSVSIGAVTQHELTEPEADLFKRADTALYESKETGKNRATIRFIA